jgi:hypothetical protein
MMSDKKIDHAALIAEAQRQRMNAELREYVHCKPNCSCRADALEAQSAPLAAPQERLGGVAAALRFRDAMTPKPPPSQASFVVDSREALRKAITPFVNDDWQRGYGSDPCGEAADALLASGVVSLAADRDRAMKAQGWDEGFKQGGPMHDVNYDDPDAHTRNPYRESEGRND